MLRAVACMAALLFGVTSDLTSWPSDYFDDNVKVLIYMNSI